MNATLPPIQPHTRAKHHILQYHLKEWFPILGNGHPLLRYIDGFAGPGQYEGGEWGSPIIALQTVKEHSFFERFSNDDKTIEFLFVEKEAQFYHPLARRVKAYTWPNSFSIDVRHEEFATTLNRLLDVATSTGRSMPPTLLFVDPFGSAGFPMELLKRMASIERVDVLINLNCLEFVQWLPDPNKHATADRLYGGPRWRPALSMEGSARTKFLIDEYEAALQDIGWRGTSFEMVNKQNQTAYHLVFGTRSPKGLEAMKRAMRSASQTGEIRYTDRIDSAQTVMSGLDKRNEYPRVIGEALFDKYEGKEVTIKHLIENEINWHRWWLESDLRKGLHYLEYGDDPRIANVRKQDNRTRKKYSYPQGCIISFSRPELGPTQSRLL